MEIQDVYVSKRWWCASGHIKVLRWRPSKNTKYPSRDTPLIAWNEGE